MYARERERERVREREREREPCDELIKIYVKSQMQKN